MSRWFGTRQTETPKFSKKRIGSGTAVFSMGNFHVFGRRKTNYLGGV